MVLSSNFKKVVAKVEGILLLAANVALVVVPAATSSLSAGQAVKYGAILNGTAYVASEVRSAIENKSLIQLMGFSPQSPLSSSNTQLLDSVASEGTAGIIGVANKLGVPATPDASSPAQVQQTRQQIARDVPPQS